MGKMISYTDKHGRMHIRKASDVQDIVVHNKTLVVHFTDGEYWVLPSDTPNEVVKSIATWMSTGELLDINTINKNM